MGSKHNSDVTLETVTLFPVILIGTRDRLMRISASISQLSIQALIFLSFFLKICFPKSFRTGIRYYLSVYLLALWHVGSQSTDQGPNPHLLHQKQGVNPWTTKKSLQALIFNVSFYTDFFLSQRELSEQEKKKQNKKAEESNRILIMAWKNPQSHLNPPIQISPQQSLGRVA